jgi:hypothetical protein
MHLKEEGRDGVTWIQLAQGRHQWRLSTTQTLFRGVNYSLCIYDFLNDGIFNIGRCVHFIKPVELTENLCYSRHSL